MRSPRLGDEDEPRGPMPQIPWAKHTRIDSVQDRSVRMTNGAMTVRVFESGKFLAWHDSRQEIINFMNPASGLTHSLRTYMKSCECSDQDCMEMWISGTPLGDYIPPGKKEWRPLDIILPPPLEGGKSRYSGDTGLIDGWRGSRFEYTKFSMEHYYGIVIRWLDDRGYPSDPWVFIGDEFSLSNFWDWQRFPIDSEADGEELNGHVENGIIWAYDYLGLFDDPDEMSKIPRWANETIANHPDDILWPELAEWLIQMYDQLPIGIQDGVRKWDENRRREMERATGQKYLWPPRRLEA